MTEIGDVSRETSGSVAPHFCTGCGKIHGAEQQDSLVEIARLETNRDIEIARIQRGEMRHATELEAETDVAIAEIHAGAGVAEAEALAGGIAEAGADAETPAIMDTPIPDAEPEVQASIEPRDDEADDAGAPPDEPKSTGLKYWP